jgi:acetylornithine deacetylase/succinyl-diaminopimelate desuccinylase-like protein
MNDDLRTTVADLMPLLRHELEALVRIPSVSAPGYDPSQVRRSAQQVAGLFTAAGLEGVRTLDVPGAHPAVFGQVAAPPGTPTVLMYAHHDVQPPGPDADWETAAFEPAERGGRLYGRGSSDNKAGIIVHLGAIRAFRGRPPVGVKILIEGEEEVGSTHLGRFLDAYQDLLAADVIVIADLANYAVGVPTLTTSLRGLVDCVVEVRTLEAAVHSGGFGGAVPDALITLVRLLATLHDENGDVAVPGLVTTPAPGPDMTEAELRAAAQPIRGLELIGTGSIISRLWTRPAISVVAIDAPQLGEAINQLVPVARAKVSLRIAPGDDPEQALAALTAHLEGNVPWGAQLTITPGAIGRAFSVAAEGVAYDAFSAAFQEAWGAELRKMGVGGSIPFVADFAHRYPDAEILLTGVADPTSRAHGPNESVDLGELEKGVLAEAIALRLLAG